MQPDSKHLDDLSSLEAGLDALETRHRSVVRGSRLRSAVAGILGLVIVLGLWQLAYTLEIKPHWALPGPATVWETLVAQFQQGVIVPTVLNSVRRALIGFAIALAVATPLGVLVARVRPVRTVLHPVLTGLQQLPSVAWVPAAIIWFGLTNTTIYAVVLLGAVPSIANGLVAGIDQIPPLHLKAGRVLGARGWDMVRFVLLPAALPGYLAGLEQGWAFAWRSLMAAELIAVSPQLGPGLGQLLDTGRQLGDMSLVLASIILILLVGIAIERLGFAPIRRRVLANRGLSPR